MAAVTDHVPTPNSSDTEEIEKPRTTKNNIIFILTAGFGSFIFGYSNNVTTGSLAQTSFNKYFLSGDNSSSIIGGILGGFLGGAFIGSILQAPIASRYGRRVTTGVAACISILAGALMAGSVHIAMFITFRIISGIGAGILTTNCPVYLTEISPSHTRGILTGVHGVAVNVGYVTSSLIALGLNFLHTQYQWRLQFCFFSFFSIILLVSLFFIPESPRWLAEVERYDEAQKVLETLHVTADGRGSRLAAAEMAQIRAQIQAERGSPTTYRHIFTTPSLRKRVLCSSIIWILNIGSGILVIANLAPLLFGGLGFDQNTQLGLSVVWVFTSGCGATLNGWLLDRFGRRPLLLIGGVIVCVVLAIEATLQKFYVGTTYLPGLNAATAMFFLYVFFWASFIDNTTYVYVPEIWPTHVRSKGAAIAYCSYYASAIATNSPAPLAFATIGYKYYFVFMGLCVSAMIYIYLEFPETKGLTLEEVAEKFGEVVQFKLNDALKDVKAAEGSGESYTELEFQSNHPSEKKV